VNARRTPQPDLEAEVERLAAAVESLAQRVVENSLDIGEVLASRRRKAPAGKTPLKTAAAATSHSYATARRLCLSDGAAIGAERVGGFWYCDQTKLVAKLGDKTVKN
jgi:hypothetical protein